jgi:FtsX-like permease family
MSRSTWISILIWQAGGQLHWKRSPYAPPSAVLKCLHPSNHDSDAGPKDAPIILLLHGLPSSSTILRRFDPNRAGSVRAAFLSVDPSLPVFRVQPMGSYIASSLAERSFTLALLGLFGGLALSLAAVGIYGLISYAVTLRTREMGIRMAFGAERGDVLAMVLRQGLALNGLGLAAGFAASLALTRLLSSLLFEVRPTDFATSAAVAFLLAAVALTASYLPARRAASVDPMIALRYE